MILDSTPTSHCNRGMNNAEQYCNGRILACSDRWRERLQQTKKRKDVY